MTNFQQQPAKPKAKPIEPTDGPRAHPGDDVYFRHAQHGPMSGRVLASGAHGCTVECAKGERHKVRWAELHGHKKRAERKATIIEQGEDGSICETEDGKRFYLQGDMPEDDSDPVEKMTKAFAELTAGLGRKPDIEEPMAKSIVLIIGGTGSTLLAKAIKNSPGLSLQQTTDKSGHQVQRWKKVGQDPKGEKRQGGHDDGPRGSAKGYGTHDIQPGSRVKFRAGEHKGEGEVSAVGKDGVTVKDSSGREHGVHHHEITHHKAGPNVKSPDVGATVLGKQEPIDAANFSAHEYAQSHDKADITPDEILSHFPPDTKDRIAAAQDRLKTIEQTIDQHKQNGAWTEQRAQLHQKIMDELLSDEAIQAARPADGEKPKFIILGGRGGSGKSSFEGQVYDKSKAIVLDADHIKGMIPEYEGWNAAQVHEESGEIFDKLVETARSMGLNVVLDKTMKTAKSAIADVNAFKEAGYTTEAHYMHLPRQEAAKRAVGRFLGGGETGRYVPIEVVLSNTTNENAFDQVKHLVDAWSFRDNNVAKGSKPILISSSDGQGQAKEKPAQPGGDEPLNKAYDGRMLMLWRTKR